MVKIKRRRKPMTPEQRAAAVERLAKAREAKGPAQHQNIHPEVLARPDDHFLSLKNVRSWIKSNKEQLSSLRGEVRRDVKGAKAKFHSVEGYIRHMQHYLKHGDWIDNAYGEHQEKSVKWVTIKASGVI
tara:strand:- start:193 stop:579 length:387 start_codon:yes stop_codon:yes gene_type:complete